MLGNSWQVTELKFIQGPGKPLVQESDLFNPVNIFDHMETFFRAKHMSNPVERPFSEMAHCSLLPLDDKCFSIPSPQPCITSPRQL